MRLNHAALLTGLLLLFNGLDALYTLFWVKSGLAVEANPLMDALLSVSPALFVAFKVVFVTALAVFLHHHRERRLAMLALKLCSFFYFLVVLYHFYCGYKFL